MRMFGNLSIFKQNLNLVTIFALLCRYWMMRTKSAIHVILTWKDVIYVISVSALYWLNRFHENIRINLESERFFTSEYVNLTNNLFDIAKSYEAASIDDNVPLFEVENDTKSIFRFRVWDCPIPKIFEIVWSSTGGLFPCGKKGNSVIFQSPQEKELRKSPITLSISRIIPSSSLILDESLKLLDQRKILLMRSMVFGG